MPKIQTKTKIQTPTLRTSQSNSELLSAGEKNILSLNLLAFRKRASHQVLVVDFEPPIGPPTKTRRVVDANGVDDAAVRTQAAPLLAAANAPSYAIFADELSGMLKVHIEWANRQAETAGVPAPSVVRYTCPAEFAYGAFGTVFRLLRRVHVTADEIVTHAAAVDLFGPFDRASLLVDLAVDESGVASDAGAAAEVAREEADPEVICCESEARTKAVTAVAAALDLPYVPFKIVFAEGVLQLSGDYSVGIPYNAIPVTPAWISLGDYENVFSSLNLADLNSGLISNNLMEFLLKNKSVEEMVKPLPLSDADSESPATDAADDQCLTPGVAVSVRSGDDSYHAEHDHANGLYYGLRVATPEAEAQINPCLFSSNHRIDSLPKDLVFLPSGDDFGDGPNTDADSTSERAGLFHRDSLGLTCFSLSEADAASEHIAAMKLDERVKECLQKKCFELPQQSAAVGAHFCNESVYGNLNLLCVTGVVRMCESDRWTFERAAAVSSDAAVVDSSTFDAWPPPEKRVES